LKNGDITGSYPEEVAWLKTNVNERQQSKESRITPDKLLTPDDVKKLIDATTNPRDRAMISVLFEGAFRPGELLNMTISSVSFQKDYCIINTKGKTGIKRIPLVVSYQPLFSNGLTFIPLEATQKHLSDVIS
jgi:integrase